MIKKICTVLLSATAVVIVGAFLVIAATGIGAPASSFHAQLAGEDSAQDPYGSFGSPCPAVKLLGVRGSGEDTAYGITVGRFAAQLAWLDHGLSASYVDYPAVAVLFPDPFEYTSTYNNSMAAGVSALQTALITFWHQCPGTDVVLAGYSQGAQVVGDVADTLNRSQRNRIAAVALFGDPRFNPRQTQVDVSPWYDPHLDGIMMHWPGQHSSPRQVPSDLAPRFQSYCLYGDPICGFTIRFLAVCKLYSSLCMHYYYTKLGLTDDAAQWAYQQLRKRGDV